jgi:hypothetical protein
MLLNFKRRVRENSPAHSGSNQYISTIIFLASIGQKCFKRWKGNISIKAMGRQLYNFLGISMGFKRRMVAIGITISFYFFQNFFEHML